jgi:Fe-S cluster biosynthesis and repair protein YggX
VRDITCSRCHETKPALDELPTGGALGQTIFDTICADCWDEWRRASGQLINHYGLNLGLPEHREQLRKVMKDFLGFEQPTSS